MGLCLGLYLPLTVHGADRQNHENIEKMEINGRFLGSSYKARLISIQIDERIVLIPYDDKTIGLEGLEKGSNVILNYRGSGKQRMAVTIVPELALIPARVEEMPAETLLEIIRTSAKDDYLLVDCRPGEFYAATHLPTAVSIPWTESAPTKAALLPADKEKLVIFYCLGATCVLGPNSAALADQAGYKNVRILLSELSEWQELGGQLLSADSYIANGNIVLIDLRSTTAYEAGHIPGSVNIPFAEIEEAEYDFPPMKSAPVVIYGADNEVNPAVDIIKGWGYSQVTVVDGGYKGWVSRGNGVGTGITLAQIKWRRELGEGEIALADFKQIVSDLPSDTIIIDVRTSEEAVKGKLKNSSHIPLSELASRLAEIPADKEIILHCTTGARAKMAYTFLRQHSSKVRYLQAKVTCKDEECRIRP